MWIRSAVAAAGALLVLIGSAAITSWAQAPYPSGPITIVLPFSAGGSADAAGGSAAKPAIANPPRPSMRMISPPPGALTAITPT